ncbi:hypothetical protein N4G70_13825 [Streptomyces sp. ASQP_92]|uniref:hypothetical protein n=1 Tax=Streptomyces sp. ASQP_92 TaxID=2979116 RepID=UPI0021BEE459|nr:hypothetical protein [Streptomyces sp. ASQP_92]MCT9089942.1 hypothetical protein [Streptomyces sp. ASQP_92]
MSETAKKNEATKSTAAKTTASSASSGVRSATTKAASAASDTKSAASEAKDTTGSKVLALRSKAKSGGEMLATVPGKSVHIASTAWTVVRNRKQIAAGVGGGVLAALAGAYSLGRVSVRRGQGPLTRVTGGRF